MNEKSKDTLFIAVSIMDRYIKVMQVKHVVLSRHDLHLTGLTSIFIASKFEDINFIKIDQLMTDAGHNTFTKDQILQREIDILKSLSFKIRDVNLLNEASKIFLLSLE